ncbi:MAG TPA: SWIM zinc finger family protein, partial [Candidatus Binatia bacterium]|nr:SWIM zinc finger family protein [Candidatus Binatia bacterium]
MTPLPVTESQIRERSTAGSFVRGKTYYQEGSVGAIVRRGNALQAEVKGSEPMPYRVAVAFHDWDDMTATCTCAYSQGGWCKHIVAT